MSFVVDSSEWVFDGWSIDQIHLALEDILQFVDQSDQREEKIWIGDDLQSRPVLGQMDLWSVVTGDGPLSHASELAQELAAWLGRAPIYLDEESWPDDIDQIDVSVDRRPPCANADVAWAHHWVRSGKPVACLGINRFGCFGTETPAGSAQVWWVKSEKDRLSFWRDAIVLIGDSEATLSELAPHAYPSILFASKSVSGVGRLAGGYRPNSQELRKTFEILNDDGVWAFTAPPPALRRDDHCAQDATGAVTNRIIEARFAGLGLLAAPENPNVYRNSLTRSAREITSQGRVLYCGWHIKLEPHRNRIHVHGPVPESDDRLVVGIIHEHLPLP
jgi:hypothetical protein